MTTTLAAPALQTSGSHLARLHGAHYRSLVRLASLLVDDVGTCEELVQDAFVALMTPWPGHQRGQGAPYLRSAVLNGARSHLRRRTVRERARPLQAVGAQRSAEAGALGGRRAPGRPRRAPVAP